ncbi:MAG TPA: hypothetical protein VJP77_05575 [Planctomycetota bacterium]|nr:hypothetical protein [Planctomycetota bacterium]
MAETVVPAIVQEWTLRTEQAQANARALGDQVDRSSKQGTAAAAQLDGAMNRTAASTDRAAKSSLTLGKQMRLATVGVALVGSAMRVASSSSDELAESLGSAAREAGIMIALMAPGPFKLAGIALLVVGGAMEAIAKRSREAAAGMNAYAEAAKKAEETRIDLIGQRIDAESRLRFIEQTGREGSDLEIRLLAARKLLENRKEWVAEARNELILLEGFGPADKKRLDFWREINKEQSKRLDEQEKEVAGLTRLVGIEHAHTRELRRQQDLASAIAATVEAGPRRTASSPFSAQADRDARDLAGDVDRLARAFGQAKADVAAMSGAIDFLNETAGDTFDEEDQRRVADMTRRFQDAEAGARTLGAELGKAQKAAEDLFERKVDFFAGAFSQNLSSTTSDAVVDGLFDGFANGDQIVIDFAKRSTKIVADAFFEALLGESTRTFATGLFKSILGIGSGAPAAAQFGGTFVGKDSIVRVAEKEPEVVLRARDLRAIERSFSTGGGGGQILVPHVVIDAERTVGQGVSRSLVRGIRPAIRRPRNVAEARIERAR